MTQKLNNTIHLAGQFQLVEDVADAAISPGMLLEKTATGVKAHATQGGFGERLFAQEDALQGLTVDDDYSTADMVQALNMVPGGKVMAMLKAGSNYTVGTQLISYGDGTLYGATGSPKQVFGVVLEALDLSAEGAVDTLGVIRTV